MQYYFRFFFAGFLFLLIPILSSAQYFNSGQEPSGKNWKKIVSTHFEVIYPVEFEDQGQRVARLMEKAYDYVGNSLHQQPRKVSVILHNQTVKSNAFLGWAPSRIEMFATPHQTIYAQDWLEQLAIHEFRHRVQLGNIETEMPRLLRYIFGEQAAALVLALHIPFWLIEGDAVCTETGLSQSGRGRFPDFYRQTRALLGSGIKYNYSKSYLGSYRDFVPDYYQMGFMLAGGARHLFQKMIWDSVFHQISVKPYMPYVFDKALKQTVGLNRTALYDSVWSYFSTAWSEEVAALSPNQEKTISPETTCYSDYLYGRQLQRNRFFAYKTTLNDIGRFVLIDQEGQEKRLFSPGHILDESVSATDSQIVWSEYQPHLRWEHADHSRIMILDIQSGHTKEFNLNSKLFAPALSPRHDQIVAVEIDDHYRFHLIIIEAKTGKRLWSYQTPENDFWFTPSWSNDGNRILAVSMRNNEKALVSIDIQSKQMNLLLPFSNQEITKPVESGRKILFTAGFSGVDNLYELDPLNGQVFQLTQSRFGVRHPSVSQNILVYSSYTKDGYQLVTADLNNITRFPVDLTEIKTKYPIAETVAQQEGETIDFSSLPTQHQHSESYSKAKNLFNFHSWAPLYIDPSSASVSPGISLFSQNLLSTAETSLGYQYSLEDRHGMVQARFTYLGWWPKTETEINFGKKSSSYYQINNIQNSSGESVGMDTVEIRFDWFQTNVYLNATLPLNFSKGRYYKYLEPRLGYQLTHIAPDKNVPEAVLSGGSFQILNTGLYFYLVSRSSYQDLQPDFGIITDVQYSTSLAGIRDYGSSYAAATRIFLPGLRPNDGLKLYGGFQDKQPSTSSFSDRIRIARGHQRVANTRMLTMGADYLFPVACPDLNLGRILYVKRIKAAVFYDQSWITGLQRSGNQVQSYQLSLKSAGLDLTSDFHLFRFIAPIEGGFRTAYLFEKGLRFDLLFNINFTF